MNKNEFHNIKEVNENDIANARKNYQDSLTENDSFAHNIQEIKQINAM